MNLTDDLIHHLADLACLEFKDPDQVKSLKGDMNQILQFVEILNSVDVGSRQPFSHPLENLDVLSEDKPVENSLSETFLTNSPSVQGRFFKFPLVIGEPGDRD